MCGAASTAAPQAPQKHHAPAEAGAWGPARGGRNRRRETPGIGAVGGEAGEASPPNSDQPRSTFSMEISIFSIAIPEVSEFMSGTYHLDGQPS